MTSKVLERVPAPALFITGGISQYTGAAFAVGLFAVMPAHTVGWLRALISALVLLAFVRPWRASWDRRTLAATTWFGLALVAMNIAFYVAIEHLPLGAVVALEFVGPVVVAARGSRTTASRLAVLLAALGVLAISVIGLDWRAVDGVGGLVVGLAATLAAALTWALYMVFAGRLVEAGRDGATTLATGTAIAALAFAPIAIWWAGPALSPRHWPALLAVGILSSVVPYLLDQVAIRRLGTATFALLNALLPATATVVGLVALRQTPGVGELLGLVAITGAVVLSSWGSRRRPLPPD